MGFPRQEHWSGLSFPSPEDLPNPGIESGPPALQADSLPSEPLGKPTQVKPNRIYLLEFEFFEKLHKDVKPTGCLSLGCSFLEMFNEFLRLRSQGYISPIPTQCH